MMILLVDQAGNPTKWIAAKDAALLYASGKVGWDIGGDVTVLRGGVNKHGKQSMLAVKPIVSTAGSGRMVAMLRQELPLGDQNRLLFRRDRHMCAYCGGVFPAPQLSRDHIFPRSLGGRDTWSNTCTPVSGAITPRVRAW